jgi:hypothetical protein
MILKPASKPGCCMHAWHVPCPQTLCPYNRYVLDNNLPSVTVIALKPAVEATLHAILLLAGRRTIYRQGEPINRTYACCCCCCPAKSWLIRLLRVEQLGSSINLLWAYIAAQAISHPTCCTAGVELGNGAITQHDMTWLVCVKCPARKR